MLTCESADGRLTVSGELQIQFLESFKEYLQAQLPHPGTLVVDLSGIGEVDLAGLQILASFALTRPQFGELKLVNLSPIMDKALRLCGLDRNLRQFVA
ncbi:MAG: STAS domain-containing protein [Thermodesulfobacteriota bacterium]